MKQKLKNITKFIVFLGIGVFLFWLVYRDQNAEEIYAALRNVDYRWIWLSLFLGFLSHISRAVRWRISLEPLGYQTRTANNFFAVMIMYLTNLAIPRLGEVTRCGIMKQYEKVPIAQSFGTVVLERMVDMLVLLGLLGLVLITQMGQVLGFLNDNPAVKNNIERLMQSKILWMGAVAFVLALVVFYLFFRKRFDKFPLYLKIKKIIKDFVDGIVSIRRMKKKYLYLFHTVFIWLMYFLMLYVPFFAFPETKAMAIQSSDMGLLMGLTVFVMASFGMVAPVSGGIGAWHFMVIGTLYVYGITDETAAKAFALVVHGSMTLLLMVLGLLSFVGLSFVNRKAENKTNPRTEASPGKE